MANKHRAFVELDADGGLFIRRDDDSTSIVRLDPNFLMGNGLFDEDRKDMTYEGDSRICTEIMDMILRAHGYACDTGELATKVRNACEPSGNVFDPADFIIMLWEDES